MHAPGEALQTEVVVECLSSASYAERPLAFYRQGQRLEVAEILSRWRLPTGAGFRVRTIQEQIFDLFYDESLDEWSISLHDQIQGIQHDEQDDRDVQD
jgi:hypothetical protein